VDLGCSMFAYGSRRPSQTCLCRDRELRVRNYLKAKSADGSLSGPKTPSETLIEPLANLRGGATVWRLPRAGGWEFGFRRSDNASNRHYP
jgi:hypothetical protein